ncbi:MAG: hypothetical protein F6K30_31160, partial [Cyanothece sp. SIO2G6]|nr:hypothetical protein [Cyanothece sp. SIO2G6]
STVGESGDLKLPHAISLHAIQVLPLLSIFLIGLKLSKLRQDLLVWLASLGFGAIVIFTQINAFAGRSIFDLDTFRTGILVASLIGVIMPFAYATLAQLNRFRSQA